MRPDRQWMYIKRKEDGYVSREFIKGVEEFVNFAESQREWMDENKIKCPCNQRKCRNTAFRDKETVTSHLLTKGFVSGYYEWIFHGESKVTVDSTNISYSTPTLEAEPSNAHETMERTYVDRHSASIAETYGQLQEQTTQPNDGSEEPHQPDCDQIFFQAVDRKNKKKRIYDTGSLSQSKFSDVGSLSTVSSGLNENPIIQEMMEKINSQTEKINSQAQELNDV